MFAPSSSFPFVHSSAVGQGLLPAHQHTEYHPLFLLVGRPLRVRAPAPIHADDCGASAYPEPTPWCHLNDCTGGPAVHLLEISTFYPNRCLWFEATILVLAMAKLHAIHRVPRRADSRAHHCGPDIWENAMVCVFDSSPLAPDSNIICAGLSPLLALLRWVLRAPCPFPNS